MLFLSCQFAGTIEINQFDVTLKATITQSQCEFLRIFVRIETLPFCDFLEEPTASSRMLSSQLILMHILKYFAILSSLKLLILHHYFIEFFHTVGNSSGKIIFISVTGVHSSRWIWHCVSVRCAVRADGRVLTKSHVIKISHAIR